jgi:hypothetical protein
MACLRATVFKIEIPSKTPRTEDFKKYCGLEATKFSVPEFVPNDEKAKEIEASVTKEEKKESQPEEEKKEEQFMINTGTSGQDSNDVESLMKRFHI